MILNVSLLVFVGAASTANRFKICQDGAWRSRGRDQARFYILLKKIIGVS